MSIPMNRTAVVLLASGLSRRYGWRDKMLEDLGGKHLMEHAAGVINGLDALVKVAVCPGDRSEISNRLIDRFVVALNNRPKEGLGRSISVGVDVALKFKPDAVLFCMADMPFIEPWMLNDVMARLGGMDGADIVHCGETSGVRPPTAFTSSCFNQLLTLEGDDGAKRIIGQGRFNVAGVSVPAPLLTDVDTRDDLDLAREQLRIRSKYLRASPGGIVAS
jgi:molybdenum cofactor cytidylyltransferase